jgi:flagellar hook protein FlgE
MINVYYSNGQTKVQGQFAVAKFNSPENLARGENMSWIPTGLSGAPSVNVSASSNAFNSGTIELSNVDLTQELVSLLSSQHDFQANAQVQQTYNQVLQTIEKL